MGHSKIYKQRGFSKIANNKSWKKKKSMSYPQQDSAWAASSNRGTDYLLTKLHASLV